MQIVPLITCATFKVFMFNKNSKSNLLLFDKTQAADTKRLERIFSIL